MKITKKKPRVYRNKAGWRAIGGKRIYFRSSWEVKFALLLQLLKERGEVIEWEHEPKVFYFEGIKRGITNYTPDFLVCWPSGKQTWVEVKGYMDAKSKTKIKRFAKYFPDETLEVMDSIWFKCNAMWLPKDETP